VGRYWVEAGMIENSYMGQEVLEPDQYLGPKRYEIRCYCHRCDREYKYITTVLTTKDRPCPRKKCKAAAIEEQIEREVANRTRMFKEQRPPGHIGHNPSVKAVDFTAELVMKDHNMTDLRDGVRSGETVAPKLAPAMQAAADGFFSSNPLASRGMNARQVQLMRQRALTGAYRGMAVDPKQAVPGAPGDPALRKIRDVQI
jgi:hypothetical protein